MTPAPSSPVPAVERIELPGGYHLRVERFELAHPWVIVCGPNDEPMLSGEVVDPYGLAAALATPTPGRAAELDVMGEVDLADGIAKVLGLKLHDAETLLSAVRIIVIRAETAEAQLATLRAAIRDADRTTRSTRSPQVWQVDADKMEVLRTLLSISGADR